MASKWNAALEAMTEEHLAAPFTTAVLGVEVAVQKVDPTGAVDRR